MKTCYAWGVAFGHAERRQPAVRLAALDLDAALLRSDGSISSWTRGILRAVQERGLELLWLTMRPARRVRSIAERAGFSGVIICGHGSCTYDLASRRVLRQELLEPELASLVVESLRAAIPGVAFAVEAGLHHGCEPKYSLPIEQGSVSDSPLRADALDLCREGVTSLSVQQDDWPLPELLAMTALLGCTRTTVTQSDTNCVDVLARGVSKVAALRAHCVARGFVAAEVLAFGSQLNDLEMLRWAGRSVAMANAHPTVLACANVVTRSNDADGVALALERLGYA